MARHSKEINICRIAEEAGVSAPTVSRVINGRLGIAEKTRSRVNDVLSRHNFQPGPSAVRTVKIAVLFPWAHFSEYFLRAMKGIYTYSQENDLTINTIVVNNKLKQSLLKTVRDQQCSGVIALLSDNYLKELDSLSGTGLPVVIVDYATGDKNMGFIDNDSYSGSVLAATHLLELGHRKIGYITYDNPVCLNQVQRFKGYENTLKARGLEISPEWIIKLDTHHCSSVWGENGYNATKLLLRNAPEITAVMATDDTMALGALTAIHEAGLRIPEDISVVGFDNYPVTAFLYPALTTVEHPLEQAGYMAIQAVREGLRNTGRWTPPREILPTSLVVRKSTGPARE